MKIPSILFLLVLFYVDVCAQRITPDKIESGKGGITIQPISHATMVLQWNGKTIYVDPVGGAEPYQGIPAPDLVLLTDIHGDHLHIPTLEAIKAEGAIFITPQAVADQLPEQFKQKLVVLNNGGSCSQLDIHFDAIPMYNLPETEDSRHPKGRGNGYVLDIGGKRLYISGDTEDIEEMRTLRKIDVAFVCMNLPFTMDVQSAASAVLDFKPEIVYPYHYRGRDGKSDVKEFKRIVNAGNNKIEVRLRDWYAVE